MMLKLFQHVQSIKKHMDSNAIQREEQCRELLQVHYIMYHVPIACLPPFQPSCTLFQMGYGNTILQLIKHMQSMRQKADGQ